ncbi:hypothetical protein [Paenibacillus sp. IHBB 10380]|uniref:hypothetical protein n=1 Tax=Paenibacillus sp. IHBB 10380 TaxID=1566358 RepID=UPI0005CFA127|nr:hypothetical protein [Paenibacillus sp. IHBB 10380]AJS58744.1 hypothetical protein UB51_09905 [Paenibacillus sp. IHBB 10380]
MKQVIVHPLRLNMESYSFTDAMYGILSEKGWFSLPKYMLSGMTAACFRFSVHRKLHRDSTTAYNWMAEHLVAADLVGITASQCAGFNFAPTFPLYQRHAVLDIKSSIDRSTGAVLWKDQFVIVNGYNDNEEVFYYTDGHAVAYQELPFCELGRNDSPYWYYQVYEDQLEIDVLQVIKESFIQAVFKWETHDLMLPESEYACGLKAYDAIVEALRAGDYDAAGAHTTFNVYAAVKKDAARYTEEARTYWPALDIVAVHYTLLATIFDEILKRLDVFEMSTLPHAQLQINKLIELFQDAKIAETSAIQSIQTLLQEPIANRFHDIGLR